MQPLRIRAYLLDGRVAGTEPYFPLDSIVAAEWIRRHHPEAFYNPPPPGQAEGWIEPDLEGIFERRGEGERWWWACSFNQARPVKEYITYWHRRFDDNMERYIDFRGRRGKVDDTSGRYKAYRMPLTILLLSYLEWYAVGDREAVLDYCRLIPAIGKKPAQGFGLVERWEVIPWPEDWSEVGPERQLMRALYDLPPGATGARKAVHGMRPPYWHRNNQAEVWIPHAAR